MRHSLLVILTFLPCFPMEAARVSIRGLQSITEREAINLISGRMEYILEGEASRARADDAAFLLRRLLVQRGFPDPRVDWSLPGENRILLTVSEGPRATVGRVVIEGADPELGEDLKAQIRSAHKVRSMDIGESTPFLVEHNKEAIRDAERLLQSQGYWDGRVILEKAAPRSGSTDVDIFVRVTPGTRFVLSPPEFDGPQTVHPDLPELLTPFHGQFATAPGIRNLRARVEEFYRKRGHQFAEVKMFATHENGKTRLRFLLDPGPRYRMGKVSVTGTSKVKPHLVRDRFTRHQGRHYDGDVLNGEIRELLGSGAFSGIRSETQARPDGRLDITLHVKEAKPEGYYFYGGAGSFEGPIIGAGYFNRNLLGNLWNLSSRAEWSGLGLLGEVSVTEPRFLGYDLRLTPSAHLTSRNFPGYSKYEAGLGAEAEWSVTENYALKAYLQNTAVTVSRDGLPPTELGPETYLLQVLGLAHVYDTRDSSVLPSEGIHARLSTDIGLALGEGSVSFLRGEGQLSYYQQVFGNAGTVAVGARAGIIIPSTSGRNLPVDLRYFLGGSGTVRSFPDRELGPRAFNGAPRGGESYWVANVEYIHGISDWLSGVVFFDTGALNRNHFNFSGGDIKYALGLGLRLDLPIGPVRLEYGHSLNPSGREPRGTFHFAIGSAF